MTTSQELKMKGNWNELRGRIEEHWSQLTSSDLDNLEGRKDQIVGKIQQKTGETSQKIEAELNHLLETVCNSAASTTEKLGQTVQNAQEHLNQASQAARQQMDRMNDSIQQGYQQAEETVRKHPTESVAVAFGTGLIAGVIVSLALRR
ncbi:hypothetical protein Pla110_17460 [Polystyrenella longa]|uniref:CsbD-like domain-containing protein n=1 Tax=Polystyrenella longa TaxID=2528007 RepID=A0A518CLI1_9PLAN|nr:CsbD family protein [Polystyrenella longa]QDU80024.1 hypothetical protein Pla110_17460 [Polystyrenella longa]